METKKYDEQCLPPTMANEPSVAYVGSVMASGNNWPRKSMAVEEYFARVRKALDKKYENIQS